MPKKTKVHPEDLEIFYQAVKGTKPLVSKKIRIAPAAKKVSARSLEKRKLAQNPLSDAFNFSEGTYLEPVSGEEFIDYKQTSISNKILRNLRKGQYNVEAVLDLHGKTADEARIAVDSFITECLHENIRVVLIIHGKGHQSHMPILKNKLNHWLRETSMVLAFCSAAAGHGSRGAMYVLLKSSTKENKA